MREHALLLNKLAPLCSETDGKLEAVHRKEPDALFLCKIPAIVCHSFRARNNLRSWIKTSKVVHRVRGVHVLLTNAVFHDSCIQIYPQGCHRLPNQISSALVAEKWLYVKGRSPPCSQAVRTALHSFSALPRLQSVCAEHGHGRTGHCTCEKLGTTNSSRVNWDSGPLLEVCPLPARYEPSQNDGYG